MRARRAFVVVLYFMLGACVAPPQLQSPPPGPASTTQALGRVALLDDTNHMTAHLNAEKTILFFQNFGGAGAGLGLLAGPFGVMANISMIEDTTKGEVAKLNGRLAMDPIEAFREATATEGFRLAESAVTGGATLSPYLYVTKPKPETFSFASALLVDYPQASPQWTGKYMYQLLFTLPAETAAGSLDAAKLAALKAEMATGMRAVLRLYVADKGKRATALRKVKFTSDFVVPRFGVELEGEEIPGPEGRVTIRTFGGVYSLVPGTVQVSAP